MAKNSKKQPLKLFSIILDPALNQKVHLIPNFISFTNRYYDIFCSSNKIKPIVIKTRIKTFTKAQLTDIILEQKSYIINKLKDRISNMDMLTFLYLNVEILPIALLLKIM